MCKECDVCGGAVEPLTPWKKEQEAYYCCYCNKRFAPNEYKKLKRYGATGGGEYSPRECVSNPSSDTSQIRGKHAKEVSQ